MRLLFTLLLALYGYSALELHEWAHVPQTVAHWLEHHTDLGHHDEESGTHHDEHGDHTPFGCDDHGTCTAFGGVSVVEEPLACTLHVPALRLVRTAPVDEDALAAFAGAKWNPPKLG